MTDQERAYYEAWKKKGADTRARKKRDLAEAVKQEEASAFADVIDAGPGYRRIKSGPNKGTVVWRGSEQQRLDEIVIAKENRRKREESRRTQMLIDREETQALLRSIKEKEASKKEKIISPEIIWAYVFIFSVSIISFLIAKLFAGLGIMGLAIFIDATCYIVKAKKTRNSKYLPFLWWF